MSNDFQTYASLSQALDVSVAAIKSWRRKFPGALPLLTRGKPLRFAPEALAACRAIRDGYGAGHSSAEIRAHLEATLPWMGRAPGAMGLAEDTPGNNEDPGKAAHSVAPAGQGGDGAALEALARTMAELLAEQRESARRLERLEQRLDQMHGHPKLLEELRALKRRQDENVQAVREGFGETGSKTENKSATDGAQAVDTTDGRPAAQEEAPATKRPDSTGPDSAAVPADQPPGRVVRIRTKSGDYKRYELKPLGPEAQDEAKSTTRPGAVRVERPVPPDEFLELPVVAQDARGDYLGVAGLTVRSLDARLEYSTTWEARGELWLLTMNTLPAQTLTLTPTVTPRGNRVAALTRLATPNSEADAAGRIEFLRGLKR